MLLASRLAEADGLEAVELNVSCPNVSGGVDFGTDAKLCYEVVSSVRKVLDCAIVTKLTPNVTRIVDIARAAKDAGTDAVTCINTVLGMAGRLAKSANPWLANVVGGLSGPAIKPIALRCVYQVASQVGVPVIGVGGIANLDDVMEFLVAGASAVQIGTANYYDPLVSLKLIRGLPDALASIGASSVREIVGTLKA